MAALAMICPRPDGHRDGRLPGAAGMSLDVAWQDAAGFAGWRLTTLAQHEAGGWVAVAHYPYKPRARTESGRASTPTDALNALATRLRGLGAYERNPVARLTSADALIRRLGGH